MSTVIIALWHQEAPWAPGGTVAQGGTVGTRRHPGTKRHRWHGYHRTWAPGGTRGTVGTRRHRGRGSSRLPLKIRSATYVSTVFARTLCHLCVHIRRPVVPCRCSVAVAETMFARAASVRGKYPHTKRGHLLRWERGAWRARNLMRIRTKRKRMMMMRRNMSTSRRGRIICSMSMT